MSQVPGLVTIVDLMANDHPMDGGIPWDHLENFYHFGEGDLPRDGDHPRDRYFS